MRPKIYIASPLGFSQEQTGYRQKVVSKLISLGFDVLDPWEASKAFDERIAIMHAENDHQKKLEMAEAIAREIGRENIRMIRQADCLLAILDGMEPDSGTVSELGFVTGLGKRVFGLRTDFRIAGELPSVPLNIQVMAFIQESGGTLFRTIDSINIKH